MKWSKTFLYIHKVCACLTKVMIPLPRKVKIYGFHYMRYLALYERYSNAN